MTTERKTDPALDGYEQDDPEKYRRDMDQLDKLINKTPVGTLVMVGIVLLQAIAWLIMWIITSIRIPKL